VGQDLSTGTSGFTALSAGTAGISYQPVSHNYIINGAFDVWQRGTSFASQNLFANAFTADRFQFYRQAGATGATLSQQTTTPEGFRFAARVQRDSGNSSTAPIRLWYSAETADSKLLAGKSVALSFYARAGANYSAASSGLVATVRTGTGTDQPVYNYTGDAASASSTVTLTTSWQRFSVTGTLPSTTNELGLEFDFTPVGTAGADDWYEITGVQLEAGSVATPFKRHAPSLQGELAACQRYYYRIGGNSLFQQLTDWGVATGTTATKYAIIPPVTMRIVPTGVEFANIQSNDSANVGSAITALALDGAVSGPALIAFNATTSSRTQHRPDRIIASNTLSAFIGLPAEL
jgi:hypothetical protein